MLKQLKKVSMLLCSKVISTEKKIVLRFLEGERPIVFRDKVIYSLDFKMPFHIKV